MKNPVLKICIAADAAWWAIAMALLMAGCTTPLFTTRGDFGPLSYEFESVYTSPAKVDVDGFLIWDGWPLREDVIERVNMPPIEQ